MSIMASRIYLAVFLSFVIYDVDGLIIPNELPTILSLVYSNIPPLKIGQDTRFGVGFRLGPHADFQTLIELGPQSNTRPIGPENPAKRDSAPSVPAPATPPHFTFLPPPPARPRPSPTPEKKKSPPKKTSSYVMDKIVFDKVPGIDTR